MKNIEYIKSLSPEGLAHAIGCGLKNGENKGCAECTCVKDGSCEGCDQAWLNWLNTEREVK